MVPFNPSMPLLHGLEPADRAFVERAHAFAAERHKGQLRKGSQREPYVRHLERVASLLLLAGVTDPVVLAAALLHDSLEDTPTTYEELAEAFGADVAELVDWLTDNKADPYPLRKWGQIQSAQVAPFPAVLIKLADKLDNLQSLLLDPPPKWTYDKRAAYVGWASAVVERLHKCPSPHPTMAAIKARLALDCKQTAHQFWEQQPSEDLT